MGRSWTLNEEKLVKQYMRDFCESTDKEIAEFLIDQEDIDRSVDSICTRMSVIRNRKAEEKQQKQEESALSEVARTALDNMSPEARKKVLSDYISF